MGNLQVDATGVEKLEIPLCLLEAFFLRFVEVEALFFVGTALSGEEESLFTFEWEAFCFWLRFLVLFTLSCGRSAAVPASPDIFVCVSAVL